MSARQIRDDAVARMAALRRIARQQPEMTLAGAIAELDGRNPDADIIAWARSVRF